MGKQTAQSSEDNKTRRSASSDLDNLQDFGSNEARQAAMKDAQDKDAHWGDSAKDIDAMFKVLQSTHPPELNGFDKNLEALRGLQEFIKKGQGDYGPFNKGDLGDVQVLYDAKVIPPHLMGPLRELITKAERMMKSQVPLD